MPTRIKFSDDLAIRIRDNYFTEEETQLLNLQCGSVHLDAKDQLLYHFGNHYLVSDEMDTFLGFGILKSEEGEIVLNKLRVLKDRMQYLMNPANFYATKRKTYVQDSSNTGENDSNTTNTYLSKSYSYNITDSLTENRGGNVTKAISAANSEVTRGIEGEVYKGLKLNSFNKKLSKKAINIAIDAQSKGLKEITLRDVPAEEKEATFEGSRQEAKLYAQQALTATHINNEYGSESTSEIATWGSNEGKGSSVSNHHSTTSNKGEVDIKEYVSSEADLKVLRMQIPHLLREFWGVFSPLFALSRIY